MTTPPVCDYEGSDYQTSFWDKGGREYEDRTEAIALKRLSPKVDASFWNSEPAPDEIRRATSALTELSCSIIRAHNLNRPSNDSANRINISMSRQMCTACRLWMALFDAATMIRILHHMADAPKALGQVKNVLRSGGVFILEFANKLNLKAIFRYLLGRQKWSPLRWSRLSL